MIECSVEGQMRGQDHVEMLRTDCFGARVYAACTWHDLKLEHDEFNVAFGTI